MKIIFCWKNRLKFTEILIDNHKNHNYYKKIIWVLNDIDFWNYSVK